MKVAIVVPARFASGRYPGKPLALLRGADGAHKPLIQRSWEAAVAVAGVCSVHVATDHPGITEVAEAFGADVVMTPADCANGSERCAAALAHLPPDIDVVVNLQGDAPLTPPHFVEALLTALATNPDAQVATPVLPAGGAIHRRLIEDQRAGRVGGTTAVADGRLHALYFSKAVIPHVPEARIGDPTTPVLLHVGVYAYRRAALQRYAATPASVLEDLEGLEQLRFLDAGVPVLLVKVDAGGRDIWELNNPSDLPVIEAELAARGIA